VYIRQRALVDGTEYEFAGEEIAPDRWRVMLDGKTFEIDLRSLGPGSFSVLIGSRSWFLHAERDGEEVVVSSRHGQLRVEMGGPGGGVAPRPGRHLSGKAELKAMMPGRVVSVLVHEGTTVQAGQGLVVIEAMKMENELKASKAGVVRDVRVTAQDTVEQGQVLMVIE
jgi:biotin carboxyl carrier protein